jgi:hypothetical protein
MADRCNAPTVAGGLCRNSARCAIKSHRQYHAATRKPAESPSPQQLRPSPSPSPSRVAQKRLQQRSRSRSAQSAQSVPFVVLTPSKPTGCGERVRRPRLWDDDPLARVLAAKRARTAVISRARAAAPAADATPQRSFPSTPPPSRRALRERSEIQLDETTPARPVLTPSPSPQPNPVLHSSPVPTPSLDEALRRGRAIRAQLREAAAAQAAALEVEEEVDVEAAEFLSCDSCSPVAMQTPHTQPQQQLAVPEGLVPAGCGAATASCPDCLWWSGGVEEMYKYQRMLVRRAHSFDVGAEVRVSWRHRCATCGGWELKRHFANAVIDARHKWG